MFQSSCMSNVEVLVVLTIKFFREGFGGPGGDQNDQTESAAILKIKESMQEEAKRFEKDPEHPDYFMQWNILFRQHRAAMIHQKLYGLTPNF